MTEKEIQELQQRIERRNFVLDRSLFEQLMKAKLARLGKHSGVNDFTTKLQNSQG